MPPSLPPDRRKPAAIAQSASPDLSPATKHRPCSISSAPRAKIDRPPAGRNSQSCCPETAPGCARLRAAAPPLPAILPDTRSRIPRCSRDPSARFPADTAKAHSPKYQSDNNSPSAAWRAPAAAIASSVRCRFPTPPPARALAAATQFHANLAAAIAFPRGSTHTPAANKSHRRAPTPPRHTNISTAALSVPRCSIPPPRRSRIPPLAPLQPVKPPPLPYVVRMTCLFLHTAEATVDIRIMRLKPVPVRTPQHARIRARRAALHHIMFSVEKIRRIPAIEIKRLKSRQRPECRGSPLPPVPQHIVNSKRAGPFRMRV